MLCIPKVVIDLSIFNFVIINVIVYSITLIAIKKCYDESRGTNIFYFIVFIHGVFDIRKNKKL